MNFILGKLLMLPAILIGFTFHEFAHAKMADKLGDKTPRFQGRLNLNPINHLDPIGTLLILFCGIGWAKPVQVNPRAFKNYYKDDLKVSLAGPLANLIVAFVGMILYVAVYLLGGYEILNGALFSVLLVISKWIVILNINLFVFNLLPLPGLDGFSILKDLSPKHFYKISDSIYKYQFLIFILIIVVGGPIIQIPSNFIFRFFFKIVGSFFGMIF
ncbi:site-2 protease family protein [Eubacterium multiforme]|uniref:Zn-dependent protease n=1 Tax=Eubacterium multiforme TaxID=83339 RepID=A0ABT9URM6_9FIRM|nr:site-2 protease family protein [Eubacterium multiforme]MDQ0148399.1 Zn-dependent protease [Eubacterium multiforme]